MLSLNCPYNQSKEKILNNLRDSFTDRNGQLNGDADKGTFNVGERLGKFSGHYQFTASEIHIQITQKPIYISKEHIQQVVSAYFERQWIGKPLHQKATASAKTTAIDDEEMELVGS